MNTPSDIVLTMKCWGLPEMRQLYTALAVSANMDATGQGVSTQEWQMLAGSLQLMVQAVIELAQQREAAIIEAVGDDSILKYVSPSDFAREAAAIIEEEIR